MIKKLNNLDASAVNEKWPFVFKLTESSFGNSYVTLNIKAFPV